MTDTTGTYADLRPGTIFTNGQGDTFIAVKDSRPYPNGTLELACVGIEDGRSARDDRGVLLLGDLPLQSGQFTDNPRGLPFADGPVTIRQHDVPFEHHTQHIPARVRSDQYAELGRCQARDELRRTTAALRDKEGRSPRQRDRALRTALRHGLDVAEVQEITGLAPEEIAAVAARR